MNYTQLSDQASCLHPDRRAILGLLVTSVLDPVLDHLPEADHAQEARRLWSEAWQAALDRDGQGLEELSSEIDGMAIMSLDDEPEGPGSYAVDFLSALVYAIGSFWSTPADDFRCCLQRTSDALYFLAQAGGRASLGGDELDALVVEAIAELSASLSSDQLAALQARFVSLRDKYAPLIADAFS